MTAWHTPDQIRAEHGLGSNLRQADIDNLLTERVPPLALARQADGESSFVLRDRVVFDGDRFEFSRYAHGGDAVTALTFLALDGYGAVVDIAAWRPPLVALWLGRVALLGEEQVLGPRLADPLRVHDSVTAWFAAGREGLFIVDAAQAAHILRNESLSVETERHARALRMQLTLAAPPIQVIGPQLCTFVHGREEAAA